MTEMTKYLEEHYPELVGINIPSLLDWFDGDLPVSPEEFSLRLTSGYKRNTNDLKWIVNWEEKNWCVSCGTLTPSQLDSHHVDCCEYVSPEDVAIRKEEYKGKLGTQEERNTHRTCTVKDGKLVLEVGLGVLQSFIVTSCHWAGDYEISDIVTLAEEIACKLNDEQSLDEYLDNCLEQVLEDGSLGVIYEDE